MASDPVSVPPDESVLLIQSAVSDATVRVTDGDIRVGPAPEAATNGVLVEEGDLISTESAFFNELWARADGDDPVGVEVVTGIALVRNPRRQFERPTDQAAREQNVVYYQADGTAQANMGGSFGVSGANIDGPVYLEQWEFALGDPYLPGLKWILKVWDEDDNTIVDIHRNHDHGGKNFDPAIRVPDGGQIRAQYTNYSSDSSPYHVDVVARRS